MSHVWDEMQKCKAVGIIWDFEAVENHHGFSPQLMFVEQDGTREQGWAPARARPEEPREGGRKLEKAGGFLTYFSNIV